jgi:ethanolamine utilization protein EutN
MHFGRVIGTVVCSVRVPSWRGQRTLLVQPTDSDGADQGRPFVAVDTTSAAPGQWVFYIKSREAAAALPDPDNPADAAIIGIVDSKREWPPGDAAKAGRP